MNVFYDGDAQNYKGSEIDLGMVVALSTGYRVPPSSFGVSAEPGTDEFYAALQALYEHGRQWGKLERTTVAGKTVSWLLPTHGRWPTVQECRDRYLLDPPDTSWMTDPPNMARYFKTLQPLLP